MTSPRPFPAPSLILGGTYFPPPAPIVFTPAAGAAGVAGPPGASASGFFLSPSKVSYSIRSSISNFVSRDVRKPDFCICENKDADQLRGDREADQRLCFRYTDSRIPLLPKSEISSIWPSSVAVQTGLCGTWSETPKTGFLTTRLI